MTSVVAQTTRARTIAVAAMLAAIAVLPGSGLATTPRLALPRLSHAPASSPSAVVDPAVRDASGMVDVIVMATGGRVGAATAAVRSAGATVGVALPLVDGLAARMTAAQAAAAARSSAVRSITLDRVGHLSQASYDQSTTASNFVKTSGAGAAWAQGDTGAGVGVAVIDSGIASHNDFAGRVVYGPDLSGEGTTIDSYGHGTVMAGIVGGDGTDARNAGMASPYMGVAPSATLVAVKAAGRSGAVDVTTMLQAMHWVASYKDQFNIRVLSLSWGVPSTQNPAVDPVDYAVERLWQLGIVVVVAAGNGGPGLSTITKPGDDPMVITVGAYDDKQNIDPADDSISAWSSRGPTAAGAIKPDIVAPGRLITAPRSRGSLVEATYPKALYAPSYIRGSGTSEATAVVSGLSALLLAARPDLTPDQVKSVFMSTALPIPIFTAKDQGAGRVQLGAALLAAPNPTFVQSAASSGLGSIEASRGGLHVQTSCNNDGVINVIFGEIDVRCELWDGSSWTGSSWTGSSWSGSSWTGSSWTGSSWTGSSWTGSSWTGSSWSGSTWTGSAWTSAVYEDTFMTAFWGTRPPWGERVAGENSDPAPKRLPLY